MKKAKVLLATPNLKGFTDGINRIAPSLGLMLIAQNLIDDGHEIKMHDFALEAWDNHKIIDAKNKLVLIGQSDEDIAKAIQDAVLIKEPGHKINLDDFERPQRAMHAIGG